MGQTYEVERSIFISAPPEDVYVHVTPLDGWEAWSPWNERDPEMVKTYKGEPGTVGSSYEWNGNRQVGQGRMAIDRLEAPNVVAVQLSFIKPFKAESVTEIRIKEFDDGSEVTWWMEGQNTLMTKFFSLFKSMDKMIGPDFDQGLASLKTLVES